MLSLKFPVFGSLFLFSVFAVLSCAPARQDMLVADVGEDEITLGEYESLFLKTSTSREEADKSSMEEREKFLNLLTNFRLKLMDAYASGLDKDPQVVSEISLYKGSLATSFLLDREVSRPGVRALYDQRQTEYHASHILLDLPPTAGPADSAAAYQKAYELIGRIKAGEDFGTLAVEHSKDATAKDNKGDLYFFTAGQMVRAFEDSVRKMQPGEVLANPVRTQYGLHVVKLHGNQPASGEMRCSHIMKRFPGPDPSPEDTANAFAEISLILDSLKLGSDFAELAKRHSQDPGSSPNGGDLGWFMRRRWVPEFDSEAFKLDSGQVSGVVRSRFGYHIIQCTGKRPAKTFEESQEELKKLYEQSRYEEDKKKFMDRLRAETGYSFDEAVFSRFVGELDTLRSMKHVQWADSLSPETRQSALMRFGTRVVTVDSTVKMLKLRSDLSATALRPAPFRGAVEKVAEQAVFLVKSETMEAQYPEFKALMKEYLEGILLYQIEQEKIWNRIAVSDSALRGFFTMNRDRFMYPDRVEYIEIRAANDSLANAFLSQIRQGAAFTDIARTDSLRMAKQNNYKLTFGNKSTRFSKETLANIKMIGEDLSKDSNLRVNIIAHPDSSGGKSGNMSLATKRLDRLKAHLTGKFGISGGRISTFVRPTKSPAEAHAAHAHPKGHDDSKALAENARLNNEIDLDILGRRPAVVASVDTVLVPLDEDERSKVANRLEVNALSEPFRYKNGFSLVRLLRREPARQKTFEEAGTEVSSAFQEHESKRLEAEWLGELRSRYPVVEHKEVLVEAFAASK
jgi:peptidyl-prolyl cis-trans isomerase SurA